MSNIIRLHPLNEEESADEVLEDAKGEYNSILILGCGSPNDRYIEARSSTNLSGGDILLMIEQLKHSLITGEYND